LPDDLLIEKVGINKIKIYDCQKYTLDQFKDFKINGETSVSWCDGLVIWMSQGHESEFMQKELIENKTLHIIAIDFAEMSKYEKIITNEANLSALCINQKSNPVIVKLVKYLKESC